MKSSFTASVQIRREVYSRDRPDMELNLLKRTKRAALLRESADLCESAMFSPLILTVEHASNLSHDLRALADVLDTLTVASTDVVRQQFIPATGNLTVADIEPYAAWCAIERAIHALHDQ